MLMSGYFSLGKVMTGLVRFCLLVSS